MTQDARLVEGAYIEYAGDLWAVVGRKRGYGGTWWELENCRDDRVVGMSEVAILRHFALVKPSPIPAHLVESMDAHMVSVGLREATMHGVGGP